MMHIRELYDWMLKHCKEEEIGHFFNLYGIKSYYPMEELEEWAGINVIHDKTN